MEKYFVGKMKMDCGGTFTSKLEGMLNDFSLAEDCFKEFEPEFLSWRQSVPQVRGMELRVDVFTVGNWPNQLKAEAVMPPELEQCKSYFSQWYLAKNSRRQLNWVLSRGEIQIKATYNSSSYIVVLSTLQGILLRAFHGISDPISFQAIGQATGISNDFLKPLLYSLSCQEPRFIVKVPPSKSINETDSFQANPKFSSGGKKRLRAAVIALDNSVSKTKIVEDRTFHIEAVIVRVMKARRRLDHNTLQMEVLHQLSFFKPTPRQIKQIVENLIAREYLARDPADVLGKYYTYCP